MKNIRILLVLALIVVVVALAQGGVGAWASKLQVGPNAAAPAPAAVGERPQGTVVGNPATPLGGTTCTTTGGVCATSSETGLSGQALTALPSGLTPPAGYTVVPTRIFQITGTGASTTAPVSFSMTPALVAGQTAQYWNGTAWVVLTAGADGKYTIPAGAPLPVTIAVFTK